MADTVVCRCGLDMLERSVLNVPYWACPQCDAKERCRSCGHPIRANEMPQIGPNQIGLVHLACPGSPEANMISALRAQIAGLERDRTEWQDLAEKRDREVEQLRREVGALILERDHLAGELEGWPEEAAHALNHVFFCGKTCEDCKRLAALALQHRP